MSDRETGVVVVGAGIAGLAAARELLRSGVEVQVVDVDSEPGGVMQSRRTAGYLVEAGPNTLQARPPLWSFVSRHGLADELVVASPESRIRSLFCRDRLVPLPTGPLSAAATPLLSARGKLRLLAEPFCRAGDPTGESVHAFASRRLGAEAATRLVGAFLTGVYAGDERELGVEAVFPALVRLEREHGSLVRGALAGVFGRRRGAPAEDGVRGRPGSWSGVEGLGGFARRLAQGLPSPVLLGSRVVSLVRDARGWRVEIERGEAGELACRARAVIVATPAQAAADLLRPIDADAARLLSAIDYAPIVAVALGADPALVREEIQGFGFLVPRDARMKLLGCLFMSRLFPGRAPPGRELLHLMLGGTRWRAAVDTPDDELLGRALSDLDRCLGLRAQPRVVQIRRWPRAIPQPGCSHVARMAELESRVSKLPGLALAGGYLAGVSVADTLASGVRAARNLLAGPCFAETGH